MKKKEDKSKSRKTKTETIRFYITGRTPSKKTSQRIVWLKKSGRPVLLPNAKYSMWEAGAILELASQKAARLPPKSRQKASGGIEEINYPINVAATIYRQSKGRKADLVNLLQSINDVLQLAGIISDDSIIASHDGSKIVYVDNPNKEGVEIIISPILKEENP